jgi:hypothetical protein
MFLPCAGHPKTPFTASQARWLLVETLGQPGMRPHAVSTTAIQLAPATACVASPQIDIC